MEVEIQTEVPTPMSTGTATPNQGEGLESLASSSSTILPPTPKAHVRPLSLGGEDEPPTYNQVAAQRAEEDKERRVVNEALARWHVGAKLRSLSVSSMPDHAHQRKHREEQQEGGTFDNDGVQLEPVKGGIAEEMVEEWKALKAELGVECLVIDKILEKSEKIPRGVANDASSSTTSDNKGKRRSGRFFNIYNTYVYGSSDGSSPSTSNSSLSGRKNLATTLTNFATQTLLFASASAIVFVALTPYLLSPVNIPGGPNNYDRAAWASYNNLGGGGGEGIAFTPAATVGLFGGVLMGRGRRVFEGAMAGGVGDGQVDAVWRVLERVGGGAVRLARGWPT